MTTSRTLRILFPLGRVAVSAAAAAVLRRESRAAADPFRHPSDDLGDFSDLDDIDAIEKIPCELCAVNGVAVLSGDNSGDNLMTGHPSGVATNTNAARTKTTVGLAGERAGEKEATDGQLP